MNEKKTLKKHLVELLQMHTTMKWIEIEEALHIKKTKAISLINDLMEDGVVERVHINGTSYRLK